MNTAIEVEYWVVTDDGALTSPGTLTDLAEFVDPEFIEPLVEIKTSPCASMPELRDELHDRVGRVVRAARRDGKRLVPLGTPINAAPADLPYRESERTELQRRIVGPTFDDARHVAGTHVHFEQSNVAAQLNALTALDPAFAAVSSSPYYRGERILECARPYLYRQSCYDGCPAQGQLWPYVDDVAEWEARLGTAFDQFRERAGARGVDEATVDEIFDPHTAVWTPVRLREEYPTVEWRSPDVALPSRVLQLTADVRTVVERADDRGTVIDADEEDEKHEADDRLRLPPFDTVQRTVDAAMHDGLSDPVVRDYLEGLGLRPERYDPPAHRFERDQVTRKVARRLRLEAADRLEADLERTVAEPAPRGSLG